MASLEKSGSLAYMRSFLSVVLIACCIVLSVLLIAEVVARVLEPEIKSWGADGFDYDPILGWLPKVGKSSVKADEYSASYEVNSYHMNDRPIDDSLGKVGTRILALGDSHTFAVGVSQEEAWPNVLEQLLFKGNRYDGEVYNAGVAGYSLGQYLLRFRSLAEIIRPHIVIIGFSSATDVYDLIPPSHGGFVYVSYAGRTYFDLDDQGELIETAWVERKNVLDPKAGIEMDFSSRARALLGRFALYRRFKKSKLAFWIAQNLQPNGRSLWSGTDTALKKDLNSEDLYRWALAEKIIQQIALEAHQIGARTMLVHIPYLAQVYDEIWEISFGKSPAHDRWVVGERLAKICEKSRIEFVDLTPQFVKLARQGKKLHYPYDGHPNSDGHRLIADVVAKAVHDRFLITR